MGRAYRVEFVRDLPTRSDREREYASRGVTLPLCHRVAWTDLMDDAPSFLLSVESEDGGRSAGMSVVMERSRALPGFTTLRVRRLGSWLPAFAIDVGLRALVDAARLRRDVLEVRVEVLSRHRGVRDRISAVTSRLGFRRPSLYRNYTRTIVIDLGRDEDEIFASFHGTARRHVRAVGKKRVTLSVVSDRTLGTRMEALMRETLDRTSGLFQTLDWSRLIEFADSHPKLVRVVGLFHTEVPGPESLLSFACGFLHGDHAEYSYAASTRRTPLKMPLGYAPAWDLIRWAKASGAEWFDFGGVTAGSHEDQHDPLGGISDFKRFFGRTVESVGDEWVLEPRPVPAAIARTVSRAAAVARRFWSGSRRRPGGEHVA